MIFLKEKQFIVTIRWFSLTPSNANTEVDKDTVSVTIS